MNTLLLEPNDVLFFKDGRPMSGGLAGHGAAWPLPTVTDGALHAALWRAGLASTSYPHRPGRNGQPTSEDRIRRFGSLVTSGPFPVKPTDGSGDEWFFPRPADAQAAGTTTVTLQPVRLERERATAEWSSSLPAFLTHAVASIREPTKDKPEPWLSRHAFQCYLQGCTNTLLGPEDFPGDDAIFLAEHTVGIGMDAATGAQDGERIYSAHYLRMREPWRLGLLVRCYDRRGGDLLASLFQQEKHILVGGQQRACTVEGPTAAAVLPLPCGRTRFASEADGKCRVKWVLLSPAVWPAIPDKDAAGRPLLDRRGQPIRAHGGGWLPNWVADHADAISGQAIAAGDVLLTEGLGVGKAARKNLDPGHRIHARLVAAVVPKAIPVTGYALPDELADTNGGPKATHLAVPAGAVYYFETVDAEGRTAAEHAEHLAAALNWHGKVDAAGHPDLSEIMNRRSTVFGEKGFGLGVCATWKCYGEGGSA